MDEVVAGDELAPPDVELLARLLDCLPLLADFHRADILLFRRRDEEEAAVVGQGRPHSVPPIHGDRRGQVVSRWEQPALFRVLERGVSLRSAPQLPEAADLEGLQAPLLQEIHPVFGARRSLIAALSLEKTMIEHERHRRRHPVFRRALRQLLEMALRGELRGTENLSPFGEHDGVMVVDAHSRIRYLSGIASNLYRRLGHMENLVGKHLSSLETQDDAFLHRALPVGACREEQTHEGSRVWVRKAIPLIGLRSIWPWSPGLPHIQGALIAIHDATAAQRREQELKIKTAMIQEIHHRVKNNLQTIASLLRMQERRTTSPEARQALHEGFQRILSVAVVHEFLSQQEGTRINLKEVSRRVIQQLQQGVLDPEKDIRLTVEGPSIYLTAQQATACALVINELLQNALEHGLDQRPGGSVRVQLKDEADKVEIAIEDDGRGLPEGFDPEQDGSLGLKIVQTLVRDDLRGQLRFDPGHPGMGGVRATVRFPKVPLGSAERGGESWDELV